MRGNSSVVWERLVASFATISMVCALVPAPALGQAANASSQATDAYDAETQTAVTEQETDASSQATASQIGIVPAETGGMADAGAAGSDLSAVTSEAASEATTASVAASTTATANGANSTDATAASTAAVDVAAQSQTISVSCRFIGLDAAGAAQTWAASTVSVADGSTADALTESLLSSAGLVHTSSNSAYGYYLSDITSPDTGAKLGWDSSTGKYWQLFVNGSASNVGASSLKLSAGDVITWYYSAYGSSLAGEGDVSYDDSTTSPTTSPSDWPASDAGGNVTTAPTPTTGTTVDWLSLVGGNYTSVSEPLLVNGKVYVAVGEGYPSGTHRDSLVRIDASTGVVEATGVLAGKISYTSRPTYDGGMVYVALEGGSVQAFNAETMLTRWISRPTSQADQSSCSLRVEGSLLLTGTASFDSNMVATSGSVIALDAATGGLLWNAANTSAGYYWTNVVQVGTRFVAADTAGVVNVLDGSTGAAGSTLALGSAVSADIVRYGDYLLVLTRDGTLHEILLASNGNLTEVASVKAVGGGKAAPTVVGNVAIVPDASTSAIVLVDLDSMSVTRTVGAADGAALPSGGISSSVLVSQQSSTVGQQALTYCYFTVNGGVYDQKTNGYSAGGWLYAYRFGDEGASLLYAPAATNANYCDSQVVCDATGRLYYLNDSGYLVRLSSSAATPTPPDSGTTDTASGGDPSAPTSTAVVGGTSSAGLASSAGTGGAWTLSSNVSGGELETASDQSSSASGAASEDAAAPGQTLGTSVGEDAVAMASAPVVARSLPVWPIVGMGAGIAALIAVLVTRRRKGEAR